MTLPQQPTDAELIAAVRAGDDAALSELHRRHVGDARRAALLVTRGDEADIVVADAFRHVYWRCRESGGPAGELKPYLRTVVRRLAFDRHRWRSQGATGDQVPVESLAEFADPLPVLASRDLVRTAYETLPPRWQEVLWRTEVEEQSPDQLVGPLGTTPNAVAALAYRAREGLRQAYLSMYVTGSIRAECRPFVPMIPALTRGTLTAAEESAVSDHIHGCSYCRDRQAEMLVLFANLRRVLVPALVGLAADGVDAGAGSTSGTDRYAVASAAAGGRGRAGSTAATSRSRAAGAAAGHRGGAESRTRRRPRPSLAGVATAAAGVVTAAVLTVVMMTSVLDSAPRQPAAEPPIVSAPIDDDSAAELIPSPTLETGRDGTDDPAEPDDEPVTSGIAPEPATTPAPAESPAPAAPATDAPSASAGDPPASTDDPPPATGPPDETAPSDAPSAPTDDPPPATEPPAAPRSAAGPTTSGSPAADDPPQGSQAPPWLCDLVPNWPGCPDHPEPLGRDSLCARFPGLPFCPVD